MVKEKLLGMCSKLLKAAQDRLNALIYNTVGYSEFIIWSELEECLKRSSSSVEGLITFHRKDQHELRKLYQRFIALHEIKPEQVENLQFNVDLTAIYSKIYNSINNQIEKFQSELINKVHSYLS
jgi:hypothetical protein